MTGNKSKLIALTKVLSSQWQQTRESWKDSRSREFDRLYMDELLNAVDQAVPVIDQLEKLVRKIRSDCE